MAAIGTIRNKFGWLLIGLMVVSLIAFLLMGVGGNGNNSYQVSDELAIVDGEAISNVAFNDNLSSNIANYKAQSKQTVLSDADMNAIRNSTYNQMISDKIFAKIYDNVGVKVGNAEFLDMLSGSHIHPGVKNSFKDEQGNFDRAAFTNYANTLDLENAPTDEPGTKRKAWKSFEKAIIKERLTKKYNNLIEKSMTVPSFMAKDNYFNTNSQVSFDYVKVPYSSINDSTLNISDSDLTAYVKNHAKEYEQDATVDIKFASFPIIASENDKVEASKWIDKKIGEWNDTENESLFISLYSDQAFDGVYYGKDELTNAYADSIFKSEVGTVFGPDKQGDSYVASKLLDRKLIADSLKARHLLITLDNVKTQEELNAKYQLFDSLYTLVDSLGYELKDLTAQFSTDQSNAGNGGDLGNVKPNQMVKPFNDMIFFNMKQGDVKRVRTQFGLHLVEVYESKPTKLAVKVATLKKDILASSKTQEKIYANASIFAGNNNTKEKFEAAEETTLVNKAVGITVDANNIQKITGNARQIIKWAFKEDVGKVSSPFAVGEAYYVAMVLNKNEKGLVNINGDQRLFIETAVAKEKKAALLKAKMTGADLNAIASANGVSVASAQSVSFLSPAIEGSQEPKIVGTALGMAENTTSKAIAGESGVYIIQVKSKTEPTDEATAYEGLKTTLRNEMKYSITSRLDDAIRKAAEVKDNRFDFF